MNVCVLWCGYGFLFGRGYKWIIFFNIYIYYFICLGGLFTSILLFFKLWELCI